MIKGAKSIAEYAIRKWLQGQGFVMEYFELTVSGNIGTLEDRTGEKMTLVYDGNSREVYVAE